MSESTRTRVVHFVRHAKSSWSDPGLRDRERPLNGRGRRDAPRMARRLASSDRAPTLVISSPAVRALTTAEIFAEALAIAVSEVQVEPELYGASFEFLIETARSIREDVGSAMIVAHDPGLSELAAALSGHEIDHVPTCGIVTVQFDVGTWGEADETTGRVIAFDYPKKARG